MFTVQSFHDALVGLQPIDLLSYQEIISEFQLLANCTQDPKHHAEGSVLIHANLALQEVLPLLNQVDNKEDKIVLYIATMLHDIGKPSTWAISPKHGRITAYGHDKVGVPLAKEFLFKYFPEFNYNMHNKILSLIEKHMLPRIWMKDGFSDNKLKLLSLAVNTKLLTLLSIADTKGRVAENMSGCELLDKFKIECERLNIYGKQYVIPNSWWVTHHGYSQARWNILIHGASEDRETLVKAEDVIQAAVPRFQLLMLVGVPGSGKSTYRNELIKQFPQAKVICMDDRRKELTGDANDQSRNQEVFAWEMKELRKAMQSKQSVVLDATNFTRKRRKPLWDIARKHGAVVGAIYFHIPLSVLLERNANREKRVPDEIVTKFYNGLEMITPEECDMLRIIEK